MKFDIRTAGNFINGRQGFAYICNSGEFTVIPVEVDKVNKKKHFIVLILSE